MSYGGNEERKGESLNHTEKKQQKKNNEEKQPENSRQQGQRKEKIVDPKQIERQLHLTNVDQKIEEVVEVDNFSVAREDKKVVCRAWF